MDWRLKAENVSQYFNHRKIFENVSFSVQSGKSVVLTGHNGSGKTTMMRILAGLLRPSAGKVELSHNGEKLDGEARYQAIGLVGPYLQLYNQLTAWENYEFFSKVRGLKADKQQFRQLMARVGLKGRELDELQTYSSGMLQRAKYVMALIHQPPVLLLDEPTSNLDEEGAQVVYEIMREQKERGILILATNEPGEIKFGDTEIRIA
ncbi:MAG: heme ABC exporter ATP-binding protein CcmA [Calditrichia bacterium]